MYGKPTSTPKVIDGVSVPGHDNGISAYCQLRTRVVERARILWLPLAYPHTYPSRFANAGAGVICGSILLGIDLEVIGTRPAGERAFLSRDL